MLQWHMCVDQWQYCDWSKAGQHVSVQLSPLTTLGCHLRTPRYHSYPSICQSPLHSARAWTCMWYLRTLSSAVPLAQDTNSIPKA